MITHSLLFFCSSSSCALRSSHSFCSLARAAFSPAAALSARSIAACRISTSLASSAFCSCSLAISSFDRDLDSCSWSDSSVFTISSSSWSLAPRARTSLACSACAVAMLTLDSASASASLVFWWSSSCVCCCRLTPRSSSTSFCSSTFLARRPCRSSCASSSDFTMYSWLLPSTAVDICSSENFFCSSLSSACVASRRTSAVAAVSSCLRASP
mmetsp:Transcript_45339/g.114808  ORF Transcript_45339/g.114808 Transcript_45339/m.114808 type:complete len:213 (+) Transcript_45339:290-928(+)